MSQFQTLNEEQFQILEELNDENKLAMLARNSMPQDTVTFYGGSKIAEGSDDYEFTYNLAFELGKRGWGIISGGGPGIMASSLAGGRKAGGKTAAFRINIPGEPPQIKADIDILFNHFSARKRALRQSDVLVYAPGGFGTLDELMENLTLIKTHKYPSKPIFLLNSEFWQGYIEWFKKILVHEKGVVDADFLQLYHVVDTCEEVIDILYGQDKNS